MYFSKETLATNSRLGGHWSELWANRNMWNLQNDSIIAAIRPAQGHHWRHSQPDLQSCRRGLLVPCTKAGDRQYRRQHD